MYKESIKKELNEEEDRHSIEPSEGSDPSGQVIEDSSAIEQQKVPVSIYRIGHSDLFACKNCKVKADKPFMIKHPQYCKGTVTERNNNGGDKK